LLNEQWAGFHESEGVCQPHTTASSFTFSGRDPSSLGHCSAQVTGDMTA